MADDKSKKGGPDRKRVAKGQNYEVAFFAEKHGISIVQARKIIAQAGPSRLKADAAARRYKKNERSGP